MMKKPRDIAESISRMNDSVWMRKSINPTEARVPIMQNPARILYLLVFSRIFKMMMLPRMPDITQIALRPEAEELPKPKGLMSWPRTTAKSMKQP